MTTNIHRQDVNQREHKHPDQIDKVPVEAADLDVFVLHFLDPRGNDSQINNSGGDVKHVQAGDGEEGGAKQRRRQSVRR